MGAKEILLTRDTAGEIADAGERIFARATTSRDNLVVTYQIPVGENVIDFMVQNRKVKRESCGKLVEISTIKTRRKAEKLSRRNRSNKDKQVLAMRESGQPFTVLYRENLEKIQRSMDSG